MSEVENLCPGCFEDKDNISLCPECGYDERQERSGVYLPYRTMLHQQYLVGKELGAGGFGITYLAYDTALECTVAIKEFFPKELVVRNADCTTLVPYSDESSESFSCGLGKFLTEARTMAKFNHPHIVRVRNLFEQNNTAYIVMDYYEGQRLDKWIEDRGGQLAEEEAMEIIMPVLEGLEKVHKKNILHRDIKPQNIIITTQGKPILIDFGAARYVTGQKSHSLSIVLTLGYSPIEQYQTKGKQGAWTDIYSCCATLYFMLSGEVPIFATERIENDTLRPLREISPGVSQILCSAIMQGLAMDIDDRPQTVDEFRKLLVPQTQPPPPIPKYYFIKGLSGEYQGNCIELSEEPVIIGRDPKKVHLFIQDTEVSRIHAQVWVDEKNQGAWLADCNSANGTFVYIDTTGSEKPYWQKIKEKKLLEPGDRFRLGKEGDEFEIESRDFIEVKAETGQGQYCIINCPKCGAQNKILIDKPRDEASCETCGTLFNATIKETDEFAIVGNKEYSNVEDKPKGVKGWIVATLIILEIVAVVIIFLVLAS